jgi:hypothetical protein
MSGPLAGTTDPIVVPDVPVAEAGVTTSELRVLIGAVVADALQTAAVFGFQLSPAQTQMIEVDMGLISLVAALYIAGRSIRKIGTTA